MSMWCCPNSSDICTSLNKVVKMVERSDGDALMKGRYRIFATGTVLVQTRALKPLHAGMIESSFARVRATSHMKSFNKTFDTSVSFSD